MDLIYWNITPLNASLLIGLLAAYLYGAKADPRRTASFVIGWLFLVMAVCSPLQFLARQQVMSAHMIAHVSVLMIGAPLMMLGLPPRLLARGPLRKASAFFGRHFWVAWLVGVGTMWFWHFPALHNSLVRHVGLSFCYPTAPGGDLSGLASAISAAYFPSLIIAGAVMVWPLVNPIRRIRGPYGVAYLFAACIGCSLLGITIAFAPVALYDFPTMTPVAHAPFEMLNMSRATDQQWAGLIMWVPGCVLYALASLALMMQWFQDEERDLWRAAAINHQRRE